ncbi:MAG: RecQ family ATP-dependent DNA helicase, partial [Acetatifactor sp.]|nr:RecQ family ATP-dependent DNA helicase [Acetatifactor sp.]
ETDIFKARFERMNVSMIVVDEAHCISQWGQDFRPSYLKIVSFIKRLNTRPVIGAFTATATGQVKEDIIAVLGLRRPQLLISGFDRQNLYFGVETPKNKLSYVMQYIESHAGDSGIVYCATRKNVEKVHEALLARGIPAARYHAGLSAQERSENQEDFIYDRKPVIVATNAFGMGIDKSNVRYVLHFNMPQSMENYYQEAGRAGRDGAESECIMLFSGQDVAVNRYLLDNKPPNEELEPEENELVRERDSQRLQSMVNYAGSTSCLRKYILEYFGEYGMQRCENCSVCRGEYEEQDCTQEARQIVTCILELRQRFGINVVAGTLHGDRRSKLLELGADRCPTYGSLQNLSEDRIKLIIRELEQREYLEATLDKYAILKVCEKAQGLLDGSDTVILRWARESENAAAKTRKTRKSDVLNHRGLELFEALKKQRLELAREAGVPPYMVFSDKTLIEMCIYLPFDRAEMLKISGVGERKYDRYGEAFLTVVREFTQGRKEKTYFGELGTARAVMELAGTRPSEKSTGRRVRSSENRQMTLFSEEGVSDEGTADDKSVRRKKIKVKKQPFMVTSMRAAEFRPTDMCLATELAAELNRLADLQTVQKLSGAEIMRYAAAQDWVREVYQEGRWRNLVTEDGDRAGFFLSKKVSQHGTEYEVVYLSAAAQQAVLDYYTDRVALSAEDGE